MFERTMKAAEAFKSSASSDLNINIAIVFSVGITIFMISMIVYFSVYEKRQKLEAFKQKLDKTDLSDAKKREVFKYLSNKYHGYMIPFFLFEKIAVDAMKHAGIENPKDTFHKVKEVRKYSK